jgi:hypothetical protein
VPEVDLYPAGGDTVVNAVLTEPVGIIIPAGFDELSESHQSLCLARVLATIAQRTHVVAALGPAGAELLLAATAATVGVETTARGYQGDQVAEVGRALAKAVPWLSKGRFEEAARRYVADIPSNLPAILAEVQYAALRIALVLSDDLSCLGLIKERGTALLGLEAAEVIPTIEDLLRFWVSPNAMAIRRQVGLA